MRAEPPRARRLLAAATVSAVMLLGACACLTSPRATAQGLADDGGASWHEEQPPPPALVPGEPPLTPIGLGAVGDIEFWAPNHGLLITAGNGSTIPPGLWTYDGSGWHELASVCGATDGRIAWAGPDEFWTISDGRPGQASEANGETPPLEDNTLCRFAGGQVATSYAAPAFTAGSYQPMHAAGCIGPSDCWFAGDPLPEPQVGAFQLHWNGSSLGAAPDPQGHAVRDMRLFEGRLYESLRLSSEDKLTEHESSEHPPVLRRINPAGVQPTFVPLSPGLPEYAPRELPEALDFLRLGADANAMWAAAGPSSRLTPAEVTVLRYAAGAWSQVLGPFHDPAGGNPFGEDVVNSIAAEPGGESAWIALDSRGDSENPSPVAPALVARISADGTISDEQTLPSQEEIETGAVAGPEGAAKRIACPAPHDCWMTTTQGWLFHLAPAGERSVPTDADPEFQGPITYRPPDEGLPQVGPDAPPIDDSGVDEGPSSPIGALLETSAPPAQARVTAPLLSHVHTRIVHRDTLELRFHLAVKARVRLLASRRKRIVASTPTRTLTAGNRHLLLRLDPRRWPTKLDLQTHALAPLPAASGEGAGSPGPGTGPTTVGTSLVTPAFARRLSGRLP
ncbi:MAG TPA: hypothetical protein VGI24_12480 [Solirubrobacteraceae bacterium]|jgi:hypothetical protein